MPLGHNIRHMLLRVALAAVAPAGGALRIVFEPPVLVDANRSGASTMDVGPPEDFHRVSGSTPRSDRELLGGAPASEQAPGVRIFGPGHTPGLPQRFDFSSDGGRHWAADGVLAQGPGLPASGIHTTYSVPNTDGSVRFASAGCCGGGLLGAAAGNVSASGWTDVGASTFAAAAGGGLNVSWDPEAVHRWRGVPSPGINVTATAAQNGIRVYPVIALPGGGYVAGVCVVWNGVAAHATPDGPKPFAPLSIVAFTSADGYAWWYAGVVANWTSLPHTTFGPNEHDTHPSRFGPPGTVLGAQEIFAVVNPNGKYFFRQGSGRAGIPG
jgi:hypothetical protein